MLSNVITKPLTVKIELMLLIRSSVPMKSMIQILLSSVC
jgi:hypothetical protein